MARNNKKPTFRVRDAPVTPVHEAKTKDSSSQNFELKPTPLFIATPALKSARTRAWKTYKGFSKDEACSQSPSNVFVRLQIPTEKLRQSGIPVIKTKWENSLTQNVTSESEPTKIGNLLQEAAGLSAQGNVNEETAEPATVGSDLENNLSKKSTDAQLSQGFEDTVEASGRSTICGTEPRQSEHIRQPPNSHVENEENQANPFLQALHPIVQLEGKTITCSPTSQSSHTSSKEKSALQSSKSCHSALFEASGILYHAERTSTKSYSNFASKSPVEARHLLSIDKKDTTTPTTEPSPRKSDIVTQNVDSNLATNSQLITDSTSLVESSECQSFLAPANRLKRTLNTGTKSAAIKRAVTTKVTRRQPIVTTPDIQDLHNSEGSDENADMAPVRDPNNVDNSLKDAIQKLYEVQSQVHGFVPETQPLLIEKMTELAHSLSHLQTLTSPTLSPNNPIHKNHIAPEVIDYVDDSRNPDIYNRLFVELVQRGNAVMNGKQQAFRDFSEIFAKALKQGMPELSKEVDRVMENANMTDDKQNSQRLGGGAANGASKVEKKNEV